MPSAAQSKKNICGICHEGFKTKSAQKDHRRDKHTQPLDQPKYSSYDIPPAAQTKKHICGVCQEGFDSKAAQKNHRWAKHSSPTQLELTSPIAYPTVQTKKYTCGICQQVFDIDSAEKQHRLSKHSRLSASQAITEASSLPSSAPFGILIHRGIVYSTISAADQGVIRNNLAILCHSEQRLKREGYKLPKTSVENEGSMTSIANLPISCPDKNLSAPKIAAIVLDCEMAGTAGGKSELIQVTMLDFLSGNILQSCLVNPSTPIKDWRENITGLNDLIMAEAVMINEALHGWEAARTELWRFANKETIIIGHSVHHDLKVLHVSHSRIIDTAIITAEAALGQSSKMRKRWGLATLCHELLGIQIRASFPPGHKGPHDALEDALATRELSLLCVRDPGQIKRWARTAKAAFFKGRSNKPTPFRAASSQRPGYLISEEIEREDDEDEEPLRWEDVIDWDTWPKSPPDSD